MADLVADRDAIRDLLARYTYNGDRGRLEALASCFADDGVLEFPGATAAGPAAIAAALAPGARDPRLTFVRHHVTNPLVEPDGDDASARSYFAVYTAIGPDHAGTYSDKLVRTAAGWRIARRLVRIDWQSDRSLFRPMASR
jgi:hypothetical protein